jgi:hypothetical protein
MGSIHRMFFFSHCFVFKLWNIVLLWLSWQPLHSTEMNEQSWLSLVEFIFLYRIVFGVSRSVHVERMYLYWMWVDAFQLIYDGNTDIMRTHSTLQDVYIYIIVQVKTCFWLRINPNSCQFTTCGQKVPYTWHATISYWVVLWLYLFCFSTEPDGLVPILTFSSLLYDPVDLMQEKKGEILPMLRYV